MRKDFQKQPSDCRRTSVKEINDKSREGRMAEVIGMPLVTTLADKISNGSFYLIVITVLQE